MNGPYTGIRQLCVGLIAAGAFLTCGAVVLAPGAQAQSRGGTDGTRQGQYRQHSPVSSVGIGGQVGDPSGLTVKIYRDGFRAGGPFRAARAFSFLAAWDLDDFFFLSAHGLYERPIPDSPLNYYIGPGAVVGIDNRPAGDADFVLGISGEFGLNFFTEHFEVFLELMPWIKVIPETDGSLGAGIGLRYYF